MPRPPRCHLGKRDRTAAAVGVEDEEEEADGEDVEEEEVVAGAEVGEMVGGAMAEAREDATSIKSHPPRTLRVNGF